MVALPASVIARVQTLLGLGGLPEPVQFLLSAGLVMTVILVGIITPYVLLVTWLERKVAGHAQGRLGPTVPGGWHGWGAPIADGVKMLQKEDVIPAKADALLFWLAPMLAFTGAFGIFAVIPWGPGLIPADLDAGAFYVIAISSLTTIGIILAGWASNNKYALYGGLRSAAQAVSFEIPLIVSLVPVIMLSGTLNLVKITRIQSGGILDWFVFARFPFMFIGFFVFLLAAIAEVNRTPFDMPEADQELVGGFHVEFTGIRFGMFFLGEYSAMLATGFVVSILFLGGWHGAWPLMNGVTTAIVTALVLAVWLGGNAVVESLYDGAEKARKLSWLPPLNAVMVALVFAVPIFLGKGLVTLIAKGMFFVFLMLWMRWTLPRVRPDQLMYICWKVLLPIALVNLAAVGTWMLWVP